MMLDMVRLPNRDYDASLCVTLGVRLMATK